MRTVIALVSYVIIAIVSYTIIVIHLSRLVPRLVFSSRSIVSLSLIRLVSSSRSASRPSSIVLAAITFFPLSIASRIVPLIRPISIPSHHEHEHAPVNMNKNELDKTAHSCCLMPLTRQANQKYGNRTPTAPDHMMTRTSPPRHIRTAFPPRIAIRKAKRDKNETMGEGATQDANDEIHDSDKQTGQDATDMRRHTDDIATHTHPPRARHKNETRRDGNMPRREAYNETRKRETQREEERNGTVYIESKPLAPQEALGLLYHDIR